MFKIKNQPLDVSFCKTCVASNQKPCPSDIKKDDFLHSAKEFLRFENGICSACIEVEKKFKGKKENTDWIEKEAKLNEILKKYRSRNGSYDCIVPGSGGKDSVFQAEILKKKYKMNPLTVTFSPIMYTDIGMKNFHNWPMYGDVNNFLYTPSGYVYGKLSRLAFENLLHPFQPFVFGQRHYASHIAKLLKIPLIFIGESFSEWGGEKELDEMIEYTPKYFTKKKNEKVLISGLEVDEVVKKHKITNQELEFFLPLEEDIVKKEGIRVLFLGEFENIQPQENFYLAANVTKFKTSTERTEGTFSKYVSLDDKVDGLHYWCAYIKFGVGRATDEAAQECRHKYITRDEAVSLVKKYDGEFPKKYFKDYLEYTKLEEEKFFEIVDKFRPSHLWEKKGNDFRFGSNWNLKKAIYK